MPAFLTGAIAYLANLVVVFGLYPYRDYIKGFDAARRTVPNPSRFCMYRYWGMMKNPSQPLLLAAPQGLLYFGYALGSGGSTGAILGGIFSGYAKVFVSTIARRMSVSSRYNRLDRLTYSSFLNCVISSSRHYGVLSFFMGGLATSFIAVLWHGVSLAVLSQMPRNGMLESTWDAFRIHSLLTFLSNPVRNTFRSSLASRERAGGVQCLRNYAAGEAAIFREAGGVFLTMWRTKGVSFFLNGVLLTTFKTSVPFAITYGTFRFFGGSIGSSVQGSGNGYIGGRRFLRRY
ncbi:unnamed protein product [Phytomonas sp. Hart1]|nr:unnamed protein product [Phytomonas sp. Hart1]|eukprot:CCW68799.1 unnamed protein product [Phytomonas sp. isolate Hart1]